VLWFKARSTEMPYPATNESGVLTLYFGVLTLYLVANNPDLDTSTPNQSTRIPNSRWVFPAWVHYGV